MCLVPPFFKFLMMKYLLIVLLFICNRAIAQDALYIKNKDSLYVNVSIGDNHMGVWPDSVFKFRVYHMTAISKEMVIIKSDRGEFASRLPVIEDYGIAEFTVKYTLVISWSNKVRAYRTIFRPYQDGD